MTSTSRPYRKPIRIAVIAALLVGATLTSVLLIAPALVQEVVSTAAAARVGEDGIRLALGGGITITADASVAPIGTEMRAAIVEQDIPGDFLAFAEPVAPVVNITLGDDLQPASPIILEFTFTEEQTANFKPDHLFVLGESDSDDQASDFIESAWDAKTRTLTGTVEHLSWYTATQVDGSRLDRQMGRWLQAQAGVRTQKPACVDDVVGASGSLVLASPWPDAVWVCASETESTVTVELTSNSGLVYEVLSDPIGKFGDLTALSPSGVLTALAARYADQAGVLEGDAIVLPGGKMKGTYGKPFDSVDIEVQIEPVLSQISSLTFGAAMLLPSKWAEGLDWYSCATDSLETLGGAELLKAITSCVAAQTGGSAGSLLNIFATGPGLVFTQIEGAIRTANGSNNEHFTVSLVAADAMRDLPDGAEWLFEHSSGGTSSSGEQDIANVPRGGTSLFAYPFSTNQWVSCTATPSTSSYSFRGEWQTLSLGLAVQANAPSGLTATVQIIGDGRTLWAGTVTRERPLPRMEVNVAGVQELTVTAVTDHRPCSTASKGWAALIQAYVT